MLRTAQEADNELKRRLLAARRSTNPLTAERKAKAKELVKQGYSKKSICIVFSCNYADLK